jgi:plasmid stabilization system protein ParE
VSPAASQKASRALREAIRPLDMFPERGRPSEGRPDVRELVVKFGSAAYVLRYRVEDKRVVVAAIFHSREDRRD